MNCLVETLECLGELGFELRRSRLQQQYFGFSPYWAASYLIDVVDTCHRDGLTKTIYVCRQPGIIGAALTFVEVIPKDKRERKEGRGRKELGRANYGDEGGLGPMKKEPAEK